jgi:hypothetical protein
MKHVEIYTSTSYDNSCQDIIKYSYKSNCTSVFIYFASDEFIIKKESDDVDFSLNNLKTLYSVKEKYRRRQKNSAGNYIPFESIDKSIYMILKPDSL